MILKIAKHDSENVFRLSHNEVLQIFCDRIPQFIRDSSQPELDVFYDY